MAFVASAQQNNNFVGFEDSERQAPGMRGPNALYVVGQEDTINSDYSYEDDSNDDTSYDEATNPSRSVSSNNSHARSPLKKAGRGSRFKRWSQQSLCYLFSGLAAFTLLAALAIVLFPKEPTWEVKHLVITPADLGKCIQATTEPSGENVTIPIKVKVDFKNPNYVGAEAGVGRFLVTWKGFDIATVSTEEGHAPARGSSEVIAHSVSVITPELGKELMSTLPGAGFKMTVDVAGDLVAVVTALFGLKVQVRLHCQVDVSTLKMMSDPDDLVTGHRCTYGIAF